MSKAKPRLGGLDVDTAERVLGNMQGYIPTLLQMIEAEPGRLVQVRLNTLASHYYHTAMLAYALGYPLGNTREALKQALGAFRGVLSQRGSTAAFNVLRVRREDDASEIRPARKEEDYSLGNSLVGQLTAEIALVLREFDLARDLVPLIWDPEDAAYIGDGKYAVLTRNEQRLAYALKYLLAGQEDQSIDHLRRMTLRKDKEQDQYLAAQASLIQAIVAQDERSFMENLRGLIMCHEALAGRRPRAPDYYICMPALGLFVIALQSGFLPSLPDLGPYLPVDLTRD